MLYYNNILCLEGAEYIRTEANPTGLVPKGTYDAQAAKETIRVFGRGGRGRTVLISYESLPAAYKQLVVARFGDPYEYASRQPLLDLINRIDPAAISFYDTYELPDGRLLPDDHKREYIKAAQIMRMIDHVYQNKKWLKKELRIEMVKFWEIVAALPQVKDAGLPTSDRRLRLRYDEWKANGYASLISKHFCNNNKRKVTSEIETLILSLYTTDKKPYAQDVLDSYNAFIRGKHQLVDEHTGELITPEQYYHNGEPIELSKATIWNIINNPINRITVDKRRLSRLEFNNRYRPHVNRHAPQFAFSKITMDDISLPFKMEDGKRAWSYQIFDVASGCVVGKSFSRSNDEGSGKNRDLFRSAVMDMFRNIVRNDWGMPAEIEVEHHISNTFTGGVNELGEFVADLLTEGHLFPFVRFCNPSNPQEKRAEHNIKAKKYGHQAKREGFQRRPFARLEANRLNEDRNRVRYSFEEIVANEEADIRDWNNSLHPDQNKYPGLTRWQVLEQMQNPNLMRPHLPSLAKHIGTPVVTSVNRTFCQVKNARYVVPVSVLSSGRLNNTPLTAYYLRDNDGQIPEVYLYQDGEFLCKALKTSSFNESKAEQTPEDREIFAQQTAHIAQFDKNIKERSAVLKKLAEVPAIDFTKPVQTVADDEPAMQDYTSYNTDTTTDPDYWANKALNDL